MKRFLLLSLLIITSGVLSAQKSVSQKLKKAPVYAGIEVGSKGVKMTILQSSGAENEYNTLKDTSVNTDFISFTDDTYKNTLSALTQLYKVAIDSYEVSPSSVFTAISSGVSTMAEKENKKDWMKNLSDDFKKAINEPGRNVKVIDVTEEARLSHIGIIPDSRRYNTFLIDIGSGNTKGGFFPYNNTHDLRLFELTWGTKSVTNETNKRLDANNINSIKAYSKELYRVLAGSADKEITYAVNVSGAYNMSDNIAFSGGIAWSVATLLFPELIENAVVPVTYDEVAKFMERIENNYASLAPEAVVNTVTDNSVDKLLVEKQVKTVNKVFDQKALLAGTGLLLKIMRQFEGVYDKKQFFLVKNGQTGWISAFVNENKGTQ